MIMNGVIHAGLLTLFQWLLNNNNKHYYKTDRDVMYNVPALFFTSSLVFYTIISITSGIPAVSR